ncbi:MAG: M55 family metallopeptidase [Planctomycetota bacterium]|nr:M55 family metallopeptidase [Planctomycetota bacterium]
MARSKGAAHGKKIYIAVDFEGAACVIGHPGKPMETLGSGLECNTAVFKQAQRLVTAETNACIRGALAAGATEVIVEDNHGSGHNLLYEELHPEAKVLMGGPRPRRFCVLDDSFAGLVLLCHHAMAGRKNGILAHSYSSVSVHRMILNGTPVGEIAFDAAIAGERGVPVILVTSDEEGCAEAREFLGKDLETVATKRGLGRNCALSLAPKKAQELTEAAARRAVAACAKRKPYKLKGPFTLEHVYKWESQADAAAKAKGAERLDAYRIRHRGKTISDLT